MPYCELKPGRLRLEDESTGTAYLFIQKDDNLLWCDVSENILQVITNVKFGAKADRPTAGKKGLLYFATDTKEFFYDNGSEWVRVVSGETGLYDADRDTYIEVEKSADEDIIRGYVANTEALKISTAGILTLPKQSVVCAYRSGNQTVPNETETKIELNSIVVDQQNEFDASTNYRFTCTEAGVYLATGQVRYINPSADANIVLKLYKNGETYALSTQKYIHSAPYPYPTFNLSALFSLSAGDYIELYTWQNSGSNVTIEGLRHDTYLLVVKVA